jgi:activator of 2-hydroxyglutaryl-CoA dehydratase
MTDALTATLGRDITVLPNPQLVGALGAALAVSPAESRGAEGKRSRGEE